MRRIVMMLVAGAMTMGTAAHAADKLHTPFSSLDAWATYTDIEARLGGTIDDADVGVGARLSVGLGSLLFVRGQLQSVNISSPDAVGPGGGTLNLDQARLLETRYDAGLRFAFGERDDFTVFATVGDYRPKYRVRVAGGELEIRDNGVIYGAGVNYQAGPSFNFGGSYSRASMNESDYDEFTVSALYQFDNTLGLFTEYRQGKIDGDAGGDIKIRDIRLGVRFSFGTAGGGGDDFF